jgi:hypothetical protein
MDDILVRNRSGEATVTVDVDVRAGDDLRLSESATVDAGSAVPYDDVWSATGEYTVTASRPGGDELTDTRTVRSTDDTLWITVVQDGTLAFELTRA